MKLLLCVRCKEVRSLPEDGSEVACRCGLVRARYLDGLNAEWNRQGFILGIKNAALNAAINRQHHHGDPADGTGYAIEAFVIPSGSPRLKPFANS
jgi:hypothetical protein